jgi:hypothetical protein
MKPVDLRIRWEELFGSGDKEIPPPIRRERWEEWKRLANEDGEHGREMVAHWSTENIDEACFGCKHQDKDWCHYSKLPCCINPVLTFPHNIIGMACCGVGYEPGQLKLF